MAALALPASYCEDPCAYRRRRTRVVRVGALGIGGAEPIRVQSMTTTDTLDVEATAAQCERLAKAGCELVRITAPTLEAARALGRIRSALHRRGVRVPLAADIHFSPQAALEAAEHVEKVRINPGNFADAKRSAGELTDAEYDRELDRVGEALLPLVEKLKRLGRALRIGVNHGSLSDRVLGRFGDTPLGMVESALEYARLCEKSGFRELVFSMKSSNPKVTLAAYRLLAARMTELGMDYPFHLGVTEAGGGEDGRIKSAIGIGALLEDGIGDTLRVSLTEDPEHEIPVCFELLRRFPPDRPEGQPSGVRLEHRPAPFSYARRAVDAVKVGPFELGGPLVLTAVAADEADAPFLRGRLGTGAFEPELLALRVGSREDLQGLKRLRAALGPDAARLALVVRFGPELEIAGEGLPLADLAGYCSQDDGEWTRFLALARQAGKPVLVSARSAPRCAAREALCREARVPAAVMLCASEEGRSLLHEYRLLAARLSESASKAPIHILAPGSSLEASVLAGGLLCEGLGDSVQAGPDIGPSEALSLVYDILQGAGARANKTEFISCPGCGRTLFDLQAATARIQERLGHLKGVKIAVMGCVVNGPGEMADADFGYVGGAAGKVNLYVGKSCVRKNLPEAEADEALEQLIKERGRWIPAASRRTT
ncbi:MAG TPA: 4-hydroxy-3-methylbut-2-en-1-yl diphosphate synthase [Elusimicrobia bacterium]|nr:4-hydroxy-3-methylbut-2-en-1-yl diphosphate synthase [Elusimicrobiota bacterium]